MSDVSTQSVQPAKTGAGPDLKTFGTAALLTFGAGTLCFVGWGLLSSGFGFFLGIVAAGAGLWWWKTIHGSMIPRGLPAKSVVILAVVNVVLFGILLLLAL
ncbi:hypothetical protein [Amycolatopsis benzoatilytica]|uniref:hypothetical protein n=1 Tax=Amycolatopsis benzoatilytica TaxID=346045 RepID=UPI00039D45EF|nr:hypothetical protein [Amycolatopsis benzoatilytica]